MSQTTKDVRVIETIKGDQQTEVLAKSIKICLFHQLLTAVVHPQPSDRPLTLQHIHHHRSNLLSLQNTSLTAGLIEHEIQALVQTGLCQHSQILILDGSNYTSKVSQLFDKYTVVKGYNYRLQGDSIESQKLGLLSYDHVLKQIEYEFKFGNGKFRPGFIGQIALVDTVKGQPYFNTFLAYLQYSSRTQCPIIINSNGYGQFAVKKTVIACNNNQLDNLNEFQIQNRFNQIEAILLMCRQKKGSQVVIYNIPINLIISCDTNNFTQTSINTTHQKIINLMNQYQFYIGFDLSRYSQSQQCINYIALLIRTFRHKIILSGGVKFKTDLSLFAGEGFLYYTNPQYSLNRIQKLVGKQLIEEVILKNKLTLLNWKIKVQEVKLILMWKCSNCNQQQPETVESFRKFGKQFCSIKCLKSYKF